MAAANNAIDEKLAHVETGRYSEITPDPDGKRVDLVVGYYPIANSALTD